MKPMKNLLKSLVWILFIEIAYIGVRVLYRDTAAFDDADKQNMINILLFGGVVLTLYEQARGRRAEHRPFPQIYIRNYKLGLAKWSLRYRKTPHVHSDPQIYFALKNIGKGPLVDYEIHAKLKGKVIKVDCEYDVCKTDDDEQRFVPLIPKYQYSDHPDIEYVKESDLNDLEFQILGKSIDLTKQEYRFRIIDIESRKIKFTGFS